MPRAALLTATAVLAAASPAVAAKTSFTVRGAGYGHGIGLSQYGAYGFATHGADYKDIVLHYYKDTRLSSAGDRAIRVLLQSDKEVIWFTAATKAGDAKLDPGARYRVVRHGLNQVELQDDQAKQIAISDSPLVVSSSSGALVLQGKAQNGLSDAPYRGTLELRPGLFGGMTAVNSLPLDEYIKGVVPGEVPSTWPPAALEAQAVVARSYSLVTDAGGAIFDQYADTRSQMYYGMSRETPRTSAAVADTSGQVVKYGDQVAVTYYFSTSGGKTENIENVYIGHPPVPYLKSVDDPYDDASPKHRWKFEWTTKQLAKKLGGWVKGKLRTVKVVQRGVSPRIVKAQVVGTKGVTEVTGSQLRFKLGLYDTWAYFIAIKTGQDGAPAPDAAPNPAPAPAPNGGSSPPAATAARAAWVRKVVGPRQLILSGSVSPRSDRVLVQTLAGGGWAPIGQGTTDAQGRYSMLVPTPGLYRVLANGAVGPVTRIR
jgi:stage II sporulation protein D